MRLVLVVVLVILRTNSHACSNGDSWCKSWPIYEVSLDCSTPNGKIAEFKKRIPELKKLGVGTIWLMPIYPRGGNPPGKPPSDSYYCVRDYFGVDPRYGSASDLKELVRLVHQSGMKLILDFVANHSSWGNPWLEQHPEYYEHDPDGRIVPAGGWTDVAKFDYRNKQVWVALIKAHKFWVQNFDVDGFREDYAIGPPLAFWQQLRAELNKIKPVFLLAEAEKPSLFPTFDADYDWTFMAYVYMIARGSWPASSIDQMLATEEKLYPLHALRMRHLDNHDIAYSGFGWDCRDRLGPAEYRYLETTTLSQKFGRGKAAFMVLAATLPNSLPMIWNGQEIGILDQTPKPVTWTASPDLDFYKRLFALFKASPAIQHGSFERVHTGHDEHVYAFRRECKSEDVLVVLNLSERAIKTPIKIRRSSIEVFSGLKMMPKTEIINLKPWSYSIFRSE